MNAQQKNIVNEGIDNITSIIPVTAVTSNEATDNDDVSSSIIFYAIGSEGHYGSFRVKLMGVVVKERMTYFETIFAHCVIKNYD